MRLSSLCRRCVISKQRKAAGRRSLLTTFPPHLSICHKPIDNREGQKLIYQDRAPSSVPVFRKRHMIFFPSLRSLDTDHGLRIKESHLKQPIPFENGHYKTKPERPSFLGRLFPSAHFYAGLVRIVFRSSHQAKRSRYGDVGWAMSSFDVFRELEKVGVTFEITGVENFRRLEGPCVFIGNHMSTLETFILPCIIEPYKDTTFVVKQSLIDYPVFRHVMRSREPIVVSRDDPREDLKAVFEQGTEILSKGRSIIIFPQKTRTPAFDPKEFNSIGIKLAVKARVPVVPIALKTDAWGNGRLLKDFGKIDPSKKVCFSFGEPMPVKGRGVAEHNAIIAYIEEHLKKWGNRD